MASQQSNRFTNLLSNSRFWILALGVVLSVFIVGLVQLLIPSGNLQVIRTEQIYGFVSVTLLFFALLASPLTKLYPGIPLKDAYLYSRRALGVLSFYYALLHSWIAFTQQLGGIGGIKYYSSEYRWSLLLGVIALIILFLMAITSLDWAVKTLGFKNWKLLHRFVYIAGVAILVHVVLVGSHYENFGFLSTLSLLAVLILLGLECLRIYKNHRANQK